MQGSRKSLIHRGAGPHGNLKEEAFKGPRGLAENKHPWSVSGRSIGPQRVMAGRDTCCSVSGLPPGASDLVKAMALGRLRHGLVSERGRVRQLG